MGEKGTNILLCEISIDVHVCAWLSKDLQGLELVKGILLLCRFSVKFRTARSYTLSVVEVQGTT